MVFHRKGWEVRNNGFRYTQDFEGFRLNSQRAGTLFLLPIVKAVGVSPVHFGMIMILNLAIGFITPPFGANLFMASEISNVKYTTLAKTIWPWIFVMIAVLLLVTYTPQISTFYLS